jgi:hypothetical protein
VCDTDEMVGEKDRSASRAEDTRSLNSWIEKVGTREPVASLALYTAMSFGTKEWRGGGGCCKESGKE